MSNAMDQYRPFPTVYKRKSHCLDSVSLIQSWRDNMWGKHLQTDVARARLEMSQKEFPAEDMSTVVEEQDF